MDFDCYTGDRGSIPAHGDLVGKWMNLCLDQPIPCGGNWVVSPRCWRHIDLQSVYNCENGLLPAIQRYRNRKVRLNNFGFLSPIQPYSKPADPNNFDAILPKTKTQTLVLYVENRGSWLTDIWKVLENLVPNPSEKIKYYNNNCWGRLCEVHFTTRETWKTLWKQFCYWWC